MTMTMTKPMTVTMTMMTMMTMMLMMVMVVMVVGFGGAFRVKNHVMSSSSPPEYLLKQEDSS